MRPPEHWHLRRPHPLRQRRRLLLIAAIAMVGLVFLARLSFSGGGQSGRDAELLVAQHTPVPTPTSIGPSLGSDTSLPSTEFVFASNAPPPRITGKSATVIEQSCGALLYGLDADKRLPPASLAKIVTALVAVEQSDLSEVAEVQVNSSLMVSSSDSSVMGLQPGQELSIRDLLNGLLLPSGNDAAIAIAEHVGGSVPAFVALMNGKVQELGLQNTHFSNPHGLDELGLYTSALDIAVLGRELMAQPVLASIVAERTYQPAWDGPPLWNGNKLIYDYPDVLGVKTGYTADAGQTIVAAAERDGRTLVVSVLGAWDRYSDAITLFNWAFANTVSPCFGGAPDLASP